MVLLFIAPGSRAQETPADAVPARRVEGSWTPNGVYPTTSWSLHGKPPPLWGSWSGSDDGTGALVFGPFVATKNFVVAVAGYPTRAGNALFVQRLADGARRLLIGFDPAESWVEMAVELPQDWIGQPIEIHATDAARGAGGWLGVSEPYAAAFDPSRVGKPTAGPPPGELILPPLLLSFGLNAALLLAPGFCLLPVLRRRVAFPDSLAALLAVALTCLWGYAVFWIYWFHPSLGRAASWAGTLGAGLGLAWQGRDGGRRRLLLVALGGRESLWPAGLALLAGMLYLGTLYLPVLHLSPGPLAEKRFFAKQMANDNVLTQTFAEKLFAGEELRPALTGDWHSSDRPPLQVGLQLLCRPLLLKAPRLHPDLVDQGAGMVFQLAWVFAAWALLRGASFSRRNAARMIAAVAPTGFLLFNSVYVWPKLGSAALAGGAFTLLLQGREAGERPTSGQVLCAGGLAGLAYLSHGAVMFALIALALTLLLLPFFLGWRRTLWGALAFVALNLPWAAYARFYDPPGNRLLKWHLAGVIPIDSRGTWQTLRESYAAAGMAGTLRNKGENFATLLGGNFSTLAALSLGGSEERRSAEFHHQFRALGIFNLGWWAGLALLGRAWRRGGPLPPGARDLLLATGVSVGSLVVWTALMFGPGSTLNHQGAYLAPIYLLVVLAACLRAASPALFAVAAIFQTGLFAATYLPAPPGLEDGGAINSLAATLVGVGAAGLLGISVWPASGKMTGNDAAPALERG